MTTKDISTISPLHFQEVETIEPETDIAAATRATPATLLKCIAKLKITFPNGTYYGTGFLFSNTSIATAGHCIYDPRHGGKAKAIEVQFLKANLSVSVKSQSKMHAPDEWMNCTVNNMDSKWMYDYAVIKLDTAVGKTVGYLDYYGSGDNLETAKNRLLDINVTVPGYLYPNTYITDTSGYINNVGKYDISFTAGLGEGKSGAPIIAQTNDSKNNKFIGIGNYGPPSSGSYPSGARLDNTILDFLDYWELRG